MAAKKKQYRVEWALDMGSAQYAAGQLVELDDEAAAPLIACGVLSDPKDDPPAEEAEG